MHDIKNITFAYIISQVRKDLQRSGCFLWTLLAQRIDRSTHTIPFCLVLEGLFYSDKPAKINATPGWWAHNPYPIPTGPNPRLVILHTHFVWTWMHDPPSTRCDKPGWRFTCLENSNPWGNLGVIERNKLWSINPYSFSHHPVLFTWVDSSRKMKIWLTQKSEMAFDDLDQDGWGILLHLQPPFPVSVLHIALVNHNKWYVRDVISSQNHVKALYLPEKNRIKINRAQWTGIRSFTLQYLCFRRSNLYKETRPVTAL